MSRDNNHRLNSNSTLGGIPIKVRNFSRSVHIGSLIALACLFQFLLGSCDENLPVYRMPENVLESTIEVDYVLSPTDNSIKVYFIIYNAFDETLEAPGVLTGTISLASVRDQNIKKTYEVGPATVIAARGYNRFNGMLRIDPGDSIRYLVSWNFRQADNGLDLRTGFFRYYPDLTCNGPTFSRCLAFKEEFVIQANVKIYDQTAPQTASRVVPLCYVSRWVLPKWCLSVDEGVCAFDSGQAISTCTPNGFDPIL